MKHLLIALAALFLSVNFAHSQEATLEGKWCLCEIRTFDPESRRLTIGARKATVVELTSDTLIWEEYTGSTTMRYRLIRTHE